MTPIIDALRPAAPRLLPLLRDPRPAPTRPPLPERGAPEIEQGVIEEARRRQRRRRLGIVLAATLAAALGAAGPRMLPSGSAGAGRPGPGGTAAPAGAGRSTSARSARNRADAGAVRIFPALGAGEVGWRLERGGMGGTCCGLLSRQAEIREGNRDPGSKGWWSATVLAGPFVASVAVEGARPVPTRSGGLPYGLRFAIIRTRSLNAKPVALNARGRRLPAPSSPAQPNRRHAYVPAHWRAPAAPPASPCEITAAHVSGLTALEGALVTDVHSFPSPESPAFQSCASTVYRLDGQPFQSSILLDAEHPGHRPAPLPGMISAPGNAHVFQAPGGLRALNPAYPAMSYQGQLYLAARRIPHGWLVVAGGRQLAPRLRLLADLQASIHLSHSPGS